MAGLVVGCCEETLAVVTLVGYEVVVGCYWFEGGEGSRASWGP